VAYLNGPGMVTLGTGPGDSAAWLRMQFLGLAPAYPGAGATQRA
jgi:hypothetical protein